MEASSTPSELSTNFFYLGLSAFIAVCVGLVVSIVLSQRNTVPSGNRDRREGFQGPALGVSDIPCGQESSEAVALCNFFATQKSSTGEGERDLQEFKLILAKLCCMKHDLLSISQSVQSTLYLPFNTSHDIENPADTVARCFTKSMPARDLEIRFNRWKERAMVLLSKLCTSYNLNKSDQEMTKNLFEVVWMDTYSVAQSVCTAPIKSETYRSPRDPRPFKPETLEDLGEYKGYY
jgi:hypothetical protein